MLRRNNFEGGIQGTTITTANSGGASGDAFNGSAGTAPMTFDNGMGRGLSMKIAQGATSSSTRMEYTGLGSITTSVWFRQYIMLPTIGKCVFCGLRDSGTLLAGEWFINGSGQISVDSSNALDIVGLTSSSVIPTNTVVRIEGRILASATVGQIEWWYYSSPDSTSVTETKLATGLNTSTNIDGARIGQVTNTVANLVSYHDEVAFSDTGPLGPATVQMQQQKTMRHTMRPPARYY